MLRIAPVVAIASALLIAAAHAELRRFCTPHGQCFTCPRGQPACEVTYALSRAMTPPTAPSLDRVVPPAPVPPPGPVYSQAAPPPPPAGPATSQAEWKRAIIDEAQRFCEAYPGDPICHFQDQPAQ
jgi:hypothetical protein